MGILMFIIAISIIALAYLVIYVLPSIIRMRSIRRTLQKQFPHERYHWFWGHLYCGYNENGLQLRDTWMKQYPRYYLYFFGPLKTRLFLNHPETVKAVMKTTEPKEVSNGGGSANIVPWIGYGLLLSNGNRWFRKRKMLTYGFHFDVLKPYVDIFNTCGETMLDIIDKKSATTKCSIDIFKPISLCALEILLKCAFSTKGNTQHNQDNAYLKTVTSIARHVYTRRFNPLLHNDFIYYLTPEGRDFWKNCQFSHKFTGDIIDNRKKELSLSHDTLESITKKRYIDFLDILLLCRDSEGNGLSRQDILDEAETFMFEGHDTTTSGMCWALYNLARHANIQQKVRQEIDTILENRDNLSWSDMNKLPYLTQCIKESMRLHPPVPFVTRELTKPLKLDGRVAPIGTEIQLAIWNVHHNPEVWEDPLKYDPDRFLPDNMAKMDSHAFVPFSAGPRNCIGQNFAMNEMKTTIAKIIRRFEISVDTTKEVRRTVNIVLRAENGIHLFFKRRDVK